MQIIHELGHVLFGVLFVMSGINHFKNVNYLTAYAKSKNLPQPKNLVLASGALLVAAPILILFGVLESFAFLGLGVFLALTAVLFHDFWNVEDPQAKQMEQIAFFKELSLIGAILIILTF